MGARNKDAGKRERKTPIPCATYRQRDRETKKAREGERERQNVMRIYCFEINVTFGTVYFPVHFSCMSDSGDIII